MTVGQKIKLIREQREMSLAQAAIGAEVTRQRFWQLENDVSDNPSIKTLAQVANGLHCSVLDIIEGTIYDNSVPANDTDLPCANAEGCKFFKAK